MVQLCEHHLEAESFSITTPFLDNHEDTGKGKSSQWAELWSVHMALQFIWKEKWPDVCLSTDSWAVDSELAGWSEPQKDHVWRIGEKDI